jgi:hypothetical protein
VDFGHTEISQDAENSVVVERVERAATRVYARQRLINFRVFWLLCRKSWRQLIERASGNFHCFPFCLKLSHIQIPISLRSMDSNSLKSNALIHSIVFIKERLTNSSQQRQLDAMAGTAPI